jgi:hypothetical protein
MDASKLSLEYQPIGHNGKVRVTVRLVDGSSFTDKLDVADARDRQRFSRAVRRGRPGIDRKVLDTELNRIADEILAKPPNGDGDDTNRGKPNQADLLVGLLATVNVELFHTPGGHDSEGFAAVTVTDHRETWSVKSKGFKRWLSKLFYDHFKKAPNSQALQDALNVIAGKAIYEGQEREVAVRIAEHGGAIYLDLADEHWRAARVDPEGWSIVTDPPVKFIRKRGMLGLPEPVHGGQLDELRRLVNMPDDEGWMLYIAWLLAACRPGRPFPILAVNGEQGSAKSTLCKMARALIDPNLAPLRRPPRDERDLLIAATNSWIVGFDNLSAITPALSDCLCLLATGGSLGTRELYTDDEEKLFDAMRPIMLNGIEDLATRADLLDRSLCVTLPAIPDDQRIDEAELKAKFEEARPRITGALLDALSTALKNLPSTRLASKPRMADFALWIVAAEPALVWEPGAFLAAYKENRGHANEQALEASIIVPPILLLMERRDNWLGTARELLDELETKYADERTRERKEWPASPRKLAGEMRRLAPNLRQTGVNIEFYRESGSKRARMIHLEGTGKSSSQQSHPSPQQDSTFNNREGAADSKPGVAPNLTNGNSVDSRLDGWDDRDGVSKNGQEIVEWIA